ncbi:MAG: hypothetical protein MJZ16_13900 [Bacteroidales bacterium]|nr:hypothetical protein [Bacteroidales bacterium]
MKKLTIALIITLTTLVCGSANAQQSRAGTLQSLADQDIDLTKLITDASSTHKVYVTFGGHTFQGEIHNDDLYLTEKDVYNVAHKVMDRMNIKPGFFRRVKHDQAEWARTGGPMDWTPIIQDCLTIGGVIPGTAGTVSSMAADAIGVQQGTTSASDGLTNLASTVSMSALEDLGASSVLAAGAHSALGDISQINSIYSALMASSHLSDYLIEHHVMDGIFDWDPLSKLMEDELRLYDFYLTTNVEILKLLEKRSSMSGWKLDISRAENSFEKRVFGITCPQLWHLECHMKAVARLSAGKTDPRDYQATYQGLFKLTIENDMSSFDQEFKQKVVLSENLPFAPYKIWFDAEDQTLSPSTLEKEINIPNFTIDIKSNDGTFMGGHEANFKMDFLLSASETGFNVNHVIDMLFDGAAWNEGILTIPGAYGKLNFSMNTKSSSSNKGLDLNLIFTSKQAIEFVQFPLSHYDYSDLLDAATPGGTDLVVTDRGVYSDLKKAGTIKVEPLKKAITVGTKSAETSVTSALAKNATPKAVQEEDDIVWPEWTLSEEVQEMINSYTKEVPSEYTWLLPEGGSKDTSIRVMGKDLLIEMKKGSDAKYDEFVSRLKAHGFTEPVSDGVQSGMKMWEARTADGKKQCAVMQNGEKISVSIEKVEKIPSPDSIKEDKEEEFDDLLKDYL